MSRSHNNCRRLKGRIQLKRGRTEFVVVLPTVITLLEDVDAPVLLYKTADIAIEPKHGGKIAVRVIRPGMTLNNSFEFQYLVYATNHGQQLCYIVTTQVIIT